MVGIISSGIGSGLDIQGLVQQLVEAEASLPSQRFAIREAQFQSRLSAYGSLRSALDTFKNSLTRLNEAETLSAKTIATSNEEAATVTVDETAVPAIYTVDIVRQASFARLTSGAFANADATIGTGTLTLSLGSDSFDVAIDAENNSLAGIRDAINNATDNTGVQATIINADDGSYLVFSGASTGAENAVTITQQGGDGGLSAITYDPDNSITNLTLSQAADDALATVNGFNVQSATNEFSGVIDGVTFNALEETAGETFTITVANDTSGVESAVKRFVVDYNALVTTAGNLASFDADTNIAGPLQGDSVLRSLTSQLRQELSEATSGAEALFDTLNEIGVSGDENGKLVVDDEQLASIVSTEFSAISRVFSGETGYASRLTAIIDEFTETDGILSARTEGLESSIESINQQRERLNSRLVALEARLTRQFNGLDSLLGQLNTTSSFLSAQLANVPVPSSGNN